MENQINDREGNGVDDGLGESKKFDGAGGNGVGVGVSVLKNPEGNGVDDGLGVLTEISVLNVIGFIMPSLNVSNGSCEPRAIAAFMLKFNLFTSSGVSVITLLLSSFVTIALKC